MEKDPANKHDLSGAPLKETTQIDLEEEKLASSSTTGSQTADGEEPTPEEKKTLRRVGEWLPASAWLVAVVELCERFTYYGLQGLFQNYIQRPLDGSDGRGALGLGHQGATGLNTFFQFWCYGKLKPSVLLSSESFCKLTILSVTPILGAIIADQYLGKYKTIVIFAGVYICGLVILFATSVPNSLQHGAGTGGFVTAIIVIGLGTGGVSSTTRSIEKPHHC